MPFKVLVIDTKIIFYYLGRIWEKSDRKIKSGKNVTRTNVTRKNVKREKCDREKRDMGKTLVIKKKRDELTNHNDTVHRTSDLQQIRE